MYNVTIEHEALIEGSYGVQSPVLICFYQKIIGKQAKIAFMQSNVTYVHDILREKKYICPVNLNDICCTK